MPVTTIADLLTLLTREPGRPRITWYGDGGERVELSGAVLENWVNKTANLLVEEFDAGPGTRVLLDLPGHWRTVVWALAAWRVGACVVPSGGSAGDVVVTDRPEKHAASAGSVIALALPALARRYEGTLPPGALDGAAAVMTYADTLGWAPQPDDRHPALVEPSVMFSDLLAAAASRSDRVLRSGGGRVDAAALLAVLGILAANGSTVLTSPGTADALRSDSGRRAALVASERVTVDELG